MVLVSDKPINPIVLAGLIALVMHFLQAGRKRATLPGTEESMTTTIDFITTLFCQVDDQLTGLPKHPEARLWPGEWQDRMLVETVLSMLTLVCHCKKVMHRVWAYFHARLAFTMAAFNVLVQWHGFQPYASGFVPLSIAEFSL